MNIIDLEKLENLKQDSDGWTAACPFCRQVEGRDRTGNHLKVFRSGKFSCIVAPSDKEHNAGILQLVGTESTGELVYTVPEPKIEMIKDWPISLLEKLIKDYSYFEGRGISAGTQNEFRLGVALSGQLSKRICCPILNQQATKIIGFSARTIVDAQPRWKILGSKKQFVYPAWLNSKIIDQKKEVILVEGIGCVLTLWDNDIKNVICLFGTKLSSKIISFLIQKNPNKIILALNNESSGIGLEAAKKAKDTLSSFFNRKKIEIRLPYRKDFNEMTKMEIMEWNNQNIQINV